MGRAIPRLQSDGESDESPQAGPSRPSLFSPRSISVRGPEDVRDGELSHLSAKPIAILIRRAEVNARQHARFDHFGESCRKLSYERRAWNVDGTR
jgi:hypothetical protein